MKLTRERKIVGGILLVALGALAADRLISGGATSDNNDRAAANASTESGTVLMASAPVAVSTGTSCNPTDELTLSKRFAAATQHQRANIVNSAAGQRDLFSPPAGWSRQTGASAADAARAAAEQFVRNHRLIATAQSREGAGGSVAVVDGRLMHAGAALDGFTLVSISRDGAVFQQGDDATAKLTLNTGTSAEAAVDTGGAVR